MPEIQLFKYQFKEKPERLGYTINEVKDKISFVIDISDDQLSELVEVTLEEMHEKLLDLLIIDLEKRLIDKKNKDAET